MKRSKRAPQKLEPILRELGFRIKEVYADCLDLMVDGVRELRRLQQLAHFLSTRGTWVCELELMTEGLASQAEDEWRVELLIGRVDHAGMTTQDYGWVASAIRSWAKAERLIKSDVDLQALRHGDMLSVEDLKWLWPADVSTFLGSDVSTFLGKEPSMRQKPKRKPRKTATGGTP